MERFKFQCLNVIHLSTPITILFARRNIIPHFLRRAILKKRLLWRKYRHFPDFNTFNNLKTQFRLVRGLSRQHRLHSETIIMQSNDNNSNQASPLPMIFNNKFTNSFLELLDAFNEFFSSVFRVPGQLAQLSLYPTSSYVPLLSSIQFSHTDVRAALVKVKPKFTSPDGYFINKLAPFISSPLTIIFNLSISMSQLPADWKHAVVSFILKEKVLLMTLLIIGP